MELIDYIIKVPKEMKEYLNCKDEYIELERIALLLYP